ncbi:MAG: prepilin-type N-terminal cleavage/methylation domain-containing protein [Bacilli bacterium]|nr:prepilin-type N-terminal cleavage/methylation domain-containing protein [Bacilli bacterium]
MVKSGGGYLNNLKKGFTLIELLAVIVILAIIALIATPIILNMINDAKKSASVDSAYGYIEAIEYNNSMAQMDNKKYTLINDGTDIDISTITNIELKGTKPESGKVSITKGRIIKAILCINSYNVEYDGKEAKVKGKCNEEEKNLETNDSLLGYVAKKNIKK